MVLLKEYLKKVSFYKKCNKTKKSMQNLTLTLKYFWREKQTKTAHTKKHVILPSGQKDKKERYQFIHTLFER